MRHKSKFKLLFCENWKEICSGEDSYTIPEEWKFVYLNEITSSLDNIRKPLNSVERAKFKGEVPYWGANSIVDKVKAHLFDGECVLLGEDAAPFFDKSKPVAFLSKGKIWPNNHIHVLLANSQKVDSKFLTFMLNRYDYDRVIDTKIRPKLTQGMMLCMGFALPNLEEQKRVL